MQKTPTLIWLKYNLYNKLNHIYFRDISPLSVEHYVKVLSWIGFKLVMWTKVLGLDQIFPFFYPFLARRSGTNYIGV